MIRKILSLSMIMIFMIVNMNLSTVIFVSADSGTAVRVEAEKYDNVSYAKKIDASNEFSGGEMLYLYETYVAGKTYKVSYNVNVPKGGAYSFEVSSSKIGVNYTSMYHIQINEGSLNSVDNAEFISNVVCNKFPNTMAKYNLGTYVLEQGENTISFVVDGKRIMDNYVIFFLDYFELQAVDWTLQDLVPGQPLGVFEDNQPVSYTLCGSYEAPVNHSYNYSVTDYWGSNVKSGNLEIMAGTKDLPFSIENLDTGWYQLNIFENGNTIFSKYFAVVPAFSERIETETPFATDLAGAWLVQNFKLSDYARAAKLAGVKWVRERLTWSQIEPSNNTYNFNNSDFPVNTISNEGLNILEVFSSAPSWAVPNGGPFPDNLFDIYDFVKNTASHYAGKVQAWEIWNESDLARYKDSADIFTAMFKAAAIGLVDSGANPLKVFGGFAYFPTQTDYADLALQNGLMTYSDIYNYHAHISYTGQSVHPIKPRNLVEHNFASLAYDEDNRPVWITEAGIRLPIASADTIPDFNQLTVQARYVVTSTVESLGYGNDKHFWFILPHNAESGYEFGSFSYLDTPYPSYVAESIMTKALGQGKYKGVLENMPVGAQGHLFNTGTGDAAVIWSENPTSIQLKSDKNLKVTDMMGGERTENCINGYVSIQISPDPVYVSFEGECDLNNYLKKEYMESSLEAHSLTDAERVVLSQKFDDSAKIDVRVDGYKITDTTPAVITVEVYNFNNKPMSGTVRGFSEGGFTINPVSASVNVGAMSKAVVSFTVSGNENVTPNVPSFLRFDGEFDGEETSPSVSRICLLRDVIIQPDGLFPNADTLGAWNLRNIAAGATVTANVGPDGAITFKCNFTGGNRWFYPQYSVNNPSMLADKDGILFWVYFDEDVPDSSINVFAYFSDGRRYNLGDVTSIGIREGWRQIYIPWAKFLIYNSPYGKDFETRPFDQTLIERLAIGINTKQDDFPQYSIKGFGYYTLPDNMRPEDKDIIINGISDNAIVGEENCNITAILPDGIIAEKTRVLLMDQEYSYNLDGSELSIDLSNIEPGSYKLSIVAYTPAGYAIRKQLNFIILNEISKKK